MPPKSEFPAVSLGNEFVSTALLGAAQLCTRHTRVIVNTGSLWLPSASPASETSLCPTAAPCKLVMKAHVPQFPPKMVQAPLSVLSLLSPEEVC